MPPKSKWWNFFVKLGDKSAKCTVCAKILQTPGNTGYLKCHIESKHQSLLSEGTTINTSYFKTRYVVNAYPQADETIVVSTDSERAFMSVSYFQEGGTKHTEITNGIAHMPFKDNLPFVKVEKPGFLKLLKGKFALLKSYTITTDISTDTMQTRSFLGTTIHYIEGEEMITCTLGVIQLDISHTLEYISTQLLELLGEWRLDPEIVYCAVTDGAANMIKAIHLAFGRNKHMCCLAHILNLTGQHAVEQREISEIIAKHFVVTSDELRHVNNLKLIQDIDTCWNSTYYMIQRFLILSSHVNDIVRHTSAPPMTTALEIETLKEIQELLYPLETATRDISRKHYMTSSIAIPIVNQVKKRLSACEQITLLSVATILDPHLKAMYFKSPEVVTKTLNEVKCLIKISKSPAISSEDSDPGECETSDNSSLFAHHRRLVHTTLTKSTPLSAEIDMPDQLAVYLTVPAEPDVKKNPLKYWTYMSVAALELSQKALKFLGSVTTLVPSEWMFSAAGCILTQDRNMLKECVLSKLLFLQNSQ
ncbi:hypothetical protein PR048_015909 [Dryococelus australis]|uniref:BED-type domain-containing protein n=1 Tax=Dryococelus australis TaxID=614101 RepID=A0ABQ9HI95_9NEOP|nr:hypothetical protein PR048_015909 [Dryococelus australis]